MKSSEFDEYKGRNPDFLNRIGVSDNETGCSSSNHKEPLMWLDDYKCSLCGVELPPTFALERQEHSDFHLAEMLQAEESGHNHNHLLSKNTYAKCTVIHHLILFYIIQIHFSFTKSIPFESKNQVRYR